MQRRTFLSFLALASTSLAMSCTKSDLKNIETTVLNIQDQLFKHYNSGSTEDIASFLSHDFSFVDGSIVGNGDLFKQRLSRLNKYHSKRGMLPLGVSSRVVNIVGEIGWVACEVTARAEGDIYGLLTQISMRRYDGKWILVRHHFSGQANPLGRKKVAV